MSLLTELSLIEMQTGLREGQLSSRGLVEAALERIAALEPSLRAFLHLAGDSALLQADEADRIGMADFSAPSWYPNRNQGRINRRAHARHSGFKNSRRLYTTLHCHSSKKIAEGRSDRNRQDQHG